MFSFPIHTCVPVQNNNLFFPTRFRLLAAKISELEQRIHALTGTNEIATTSSLSPSQILLNGYSSATVDADLIEEIKQLKIANHSELSDSGGTEGKCNVERTSSNTSQGLLTELLSSESNKSLPSCSEIGDQDYGTASSSDLTSNAEDSTGILLEPYIKANRSGSTDSKLPELPPEIAELVRQLSNSMDDGANWKRMEFVNTFNDLESWLTHVYVGGLFSFPGTVQQSSNARLG